MLLAVWKLLLSCNLGAASINRSRGQRARSENPDDKTQILEDTTMAWVFVSVPGVVIGLPGLISLVLRSWDDHRLRVITGVFGSAGVFFIVVQIWYYVEWSHSEYGKHFKWGASYGVHVYLAIWWICFLISLYSDWVLGLISGDLAGAPGGGVALFYWIYFVAKRLPLFLQ
jgi:hypothetical protein